MAKIDVSKVKDEVEYIVELAKSIKVGPSWVRPDCHVKLKGKVIKEFADAIVSVENA